MYVRVAGQHVSMANAIPFAVEAVSSRHPERELEIRCGRLHVRVVELVPAQSIAHRVEGILSDGLERGIPVPLGFGGEGEGDG